MTLACLKEVQSLAKRDGKSDVPSELVDFFRKGSVIFLNERNEPIKFARVIVTWEN